MPGEMNPRERWSLLLIDEFPDRPPVFPLVTSHAANVYGCNLVEYCTDGKILAEAQLAAQRQYGHDGLSVFTDVGIIAEAMGSRYRMREFDVPIIEEPVIPQSEQLDELRLPNPVSDGRLPVYLEAIERLYNAIGDELPVFAYIPCPFTTAAGLRGTEELLIDTITAPETTHKLLELSLRAAIRLCDECIFCGALPILVDPLASGSVISRNTFNQFAKPYQKRLIEYLHRYDLDITLHICGDTINIVDLIPETGADLFSFDKLNISIPLERIGDKVRLVGNLAPYGLLSSSEMNIENESEKIIERGLVNPKGFVFSTGCEVPIKCDREKLQRMIDVGRKANYEK